MNYDVEQQCLSPVVSTSAVLNSIKPKLLAEYELEWQEKLNSDVAMRGINAGGNKLRTYRKFKHSYSTEPYVKIITSKIYRSAYAKFRCGVAPLKIETCRYGLNRIPVEERLCESCQVVEDEFHVMMVCPRLMIFAPNLYYSLMRLSKVLTITHKKNNSFMLCQTQLVVR